MCNVLTYDLCRLETIKYDATLSLEEATRAIISYEIKLSYRYELLAKIVRRSAMLTRECLLTVFSLNPAWKNYMALAEFHNHCSSSKHYQSLDGLNSIIGHVEHSDYDPTVNPVQSMQQGDKLAVRLDNKYDLWDDLVTVIINPRVKTLRWSTNNWSELQKLCLRFHNQPDYKVCLIKQNVAAANRNGLWYARGNSRELARRMLHRTIKRLMHRKLKFERRRYACCHNTSGELVGFLEI